MNKLGLSMVALGLLILNAEALNLSLGNYKSKKEAEVFYQKAVKKYNHLGEVAMSELQGYNVVFIRVKGGKKQRQAILNEVRQSVKNAYFMRPLEADQTYTNNKDKAVKKTQDETKSAQKEQMLKNLEKEMINNLQEVSYSRYNLFDLIRQYVQNNPKIAASDLNHQQNVMSKMHAKNAYYPTLDFTATGGYISKKDNNFKTHISKSDSGLNASYGLSLNQNIYNGGYDKARENSTEHQALASAYKHIQNTDDLVYKAINAYVELKKTYELLQIAQSNLKANENTYRLIKQRVNEGFVQNSDLSQAGTKVSLANSNLISAKHNYADAKSTFKKTFGFYAEGNELSDVVYNSLVPSDLKTLNNNSYACNPAYIMAGLNVLIAKSGIGESKAAFKPKLDLELYANQEYNRLDNENLRSNNAGAMMRFRYNIFNKGQDKIGLDRARINLLEQEKSEVGIKEDLSESNELAYDIYINTKEKIKYLNEHLRYAQATLEAYNEEYKIGHRDLANLLDAEAELNNAKQELVKTQTELLMSRYKMSLNMGLLTDLFIHGYSKSYAESACVNAKFK